MITARFSIKNVCDKAAYNIEYGGGDLVSTNDMKHKHNKSIDQIEEKGGQFILKVEMSQVWPMNMEINMIK